jgi:CRP-like cAMP-binding protein
MDTAKIAFLKECPLFFGFHEGQYASLSDLACTHEYNPDDTVIAEDAPGDTFFILMDGEINIEKRAPDGGRHILTTLDKPGDFFGEMAIVDVRPRSASARAKGKTRILSVSKDDLLKLFEEYEELMMLVPYNIARVLSERLRAADDTMAAVSG